MIKEKQKSAFVYFSILTIPCLTLPGFNDRPEIHSHKKRRHEKGITSELRVELKDTLKKSKVCFSMFWQTKKVYVCFFPCWSNSICFARSGERKSEFRVSCHDRREPVVTILQILVSFYLPAALFVCTLQWIGWIRINIIHIPRHLLLHCKNFWSNIRIRTSLKRIKINSH